MLQIRVGVQLTSLRQPFKKALHTAAQLGADGVEIDARSSLRPSELSRTGVRQVRKMLEDLNLRVCAVRYPTRRGYNVPDSLDERIEGTKAAMTMAYDLGTSVVINHVGAIPEDVESADWKLLIESLSDLGRYGDRVGAFMAAETGAEPPDRMQNLIDALPDGALHVNFDPGNLVINGHSVADALAHLARHIVHVHAKDGVRDLAQGRGIEVPLGRGVVDFAEVMAKLEEHRYQGYFTVERENAKHPVAEIADAVSYLRAAD